MNQMKVGKISFFAMAMALGAFWTGLDASEQVIRLDWSELKNKEIHADEKIQVKGYVHAQQGELYLTAMSGGACCSGETGEKKIHLVGADPSLSAVDPQKPVVVEGHVKEAGHACGHESCNHKHEDPKERCTGHEHGGCCALIDLEDPYLVDDDGASKIYTGGVLGCILLGIAAVVGYQMFKKK
jgi:hypothetical protein